MKTNPDLAKLALHVCLKSREFKGILGIRTPSDARFSSQQASGALLGIPKDTDSLQRMTEAQ